MHSFGGIYHGRKVLVTGHTGFKGSWLVLLLQSMGADVSGFSLPPPTNPSHFNLLGLKMNSSIGDIRDIVKLKDVLCRQKPEIVFHLAAQPLVIESYRNPLETFSSNIMGTANLLELCRYCPSVKAVVNVTSDKCYLNEGSDRKKFNEKDPLGGKDPYSASKACSEIVTQAFRCIMDTEDKSAGKFLVASARAGNVIGGGDWASHRLLPDIVRSVVSGSELVIRFPEASRPWQHVLDVLIGYLLIGQKLLEGKSEYAQAWNIGPVESVKVRRVLEMAGKEWPVLKNADIKILPSPCFKESESLSLDCRKAMSVLKWCNLWPVDRAVEKTIQWFRVFYGDGKIVSRDDIEMYFSDAAGKKVEWISNQ